ncbi:MAG: hypothetical protein ACR2IP_00210 [Solirubrobacteraceae bacterium]
MTTTSHTKSSTPTFDADTAFEHIKDLNEQVLAATRKAGASYLESCEKAVDRTIELERKLAGMTQQEWLRSLVDAQADITRELARTYTSTARNLLK